MCSFRKIQRNWSPIIFSWWGLKHECAKVGLPATDVIVDTWAARLEFAFDKTLSAHSLWHNKSKRWTWEIKLSLGEQNHLHHLDINHARQKKALDIVAALNGTFCALAGDDECFLNFLLRQQAALSSTPKFQHVHIVSLLLAGVALFAGQQDE